MPIIVPNQINRISQADFGEVAYEVMEHVFGIHKDFGCFFDEKIYKRELAQRMPSVQLEVPVDVVFQSFRKRFLLDVLVNGSALFEFKAGERFVSRHRGQLINYLFLTDLAHGKLVNTRPQIVRHEFVNCRWRLSDLRNPIIREHEWQLSLPGASHFQEVLTSLIRDWGCGLDIGLYEEAMTHFMGGELTVMQDVPVDNLGTQRMRLINPETAFKLTALSENEDEFADHTRRLLKHTPLTAILWANITHKYLTFRTLC